MRSLVRVRVSERQFRLPTTKKKTIWLASLLLEPQTPWKKSGILMMKENIGDLATRFKPWTEQWNYHRKLKTIKNVHTPAEHNNHVSLLFRRELKRIWNRLGGDKSLLGTFTERDETFAKVVWIQITNLIKMVQFRCGSEFTVLPTDGKNSDQWRRKDPGNREASQLTGIRKITRKRKIRDLKHWKSRIPSDPNTSVSMELSRSDTF